ncbi:MAG: hypothetical protein U1E93_01080 [Alphaproteobacteria bacterium]
MALSRLALVLAVIAAWGCGGVLSIRNSTSSSRLRAGVFVMATWNPGQIEVPQELLMPLAASVGTLAIHWGLIENAINLKLALIHDYAGGKEIKPNLPRTALWKKIEYLEECLEKIPALEPYRLELQGVLDRVGDKSQIRSHVLHGFVSGYTPENQRICFTRLDPDKNGRVANNLHASLHELAIAGADAVSLASDAADAFKRLESAFWRKNVTY